MESNQNVRNTYFILILVVYILLIILLMEDPVTIIGNPGPIKYTDSTLHIPYIGSPFTPFAKITP